MRREFRSIRLGHRRIFGVLISSGYRVEEWNGREWEYHSTQPDWDSVKSLMASIRKQGGFSTSSFGINQREYPTMHFSFSP